MILLVIYEGSGEVLFAYIVRAVTRKYAAVVLSWYGGRLRGRTALDIPLQAPEIGRI